MMQDGILYSRTKASDEWKVVEQDAKYAEWNLNTVKNSIKRGLTRESYVVGQEEYDSMIECEKQRNAFDVKLFEIEAKSISRSFEKIFAAYSSKKQDNNLDVLLRTSIFLKILFLLSIIFMHRRFFPTKTEQKVLSAL